MAFNLDFVGFCLRCQKGVKSNDDNFSVAKPKRKKCGKFLLAFLEKIFANKILNVDLEQMPKFTNNLSMSIWVDIRPNCTFMLSRFCLIARQLILLPSKQFCTQNFKSKSEKVSDRTVSWASLSLCSVLRFCTHYYYLLYMYIIRPLQAHYKKNEKMVTSRWAFSIA